MLTSAPTSFSYDAGNHPVAMSGAVQMQYDALGKRVVKSANGLTTPVCSIVAGYTCERTKWTYARNQKSWRGSISCDGYAA